MADEYTYVHITGSWAHLINDGVLDDDALPDEVLPTGKVVFTPNLGSYGSLPTGLPSRSVSASPITGLVVDGRLRDLHRRDGVELVGAIGDYPVWWTATAELWWNNKKLGSRTVQFAANGNRELHLNDLIDAGDLPRDYWPTYLDAAASAARAEVAADSAKANAARAEFVAETIYDIGEQVDQVNAGLGETRTARDEAQAAAASTADDRAHIYQVVADGAAAIRDHVQADADRAQNQAGIAGARTADAEAAATAAATSEAAATASATTAGQKATTAAQKATAAETSANQAGASAGSAQTFRNQAESFAGAAQSAADTAAQEAADETVEILTQSVAADRAAAAAAATAAGTSGGNAKDSEDNAKDSESSAMAAAAAAAASESNSSASASAASGSAGAAATSATAADAAKNAAQAAASSFSLSAGTVTTGGPSSSAQVNVTGTTPAYTLNFTIPRGAQGPQGEGLQIDFTPANYGSLPTGLNATTDVGKTAWVQSNSRLYIWNGSSWPAEGSGQVLAGAKGDNGATAYQVAVANGFVGSESEWLDTLVGDPGAPGQSAYQVAVANGFVGDQTAWLASLNGEDGADHWDDLDGKPTTFPATWAGVSGKPSSYPSTWSEVSGKPPTFAPTVGTGATEAKPGNWQPSWSDVQSKPTTFPPTIGSGATQAVAGNDPRLSDARTPVEHSASLLTSGTLDSARLPAITSAMITDGTLVDADISSSAAIGKTKLAAPVQTSLGNADKAQITYGVCGKDTARAVGAGDNVLGIRLAQAVTINSFFARCVTADASGNLVIELRKNGTSVSGTSHSIASGSQVVGTAKTGLSAAFAVGDILTVHITGVGGTPGQGLTVDLAGVCD